MADFMIRFLICNIFISFMVGILFSVKSLLKNILSARMQYQMWFLFLFLLAVPFIPFRPVGFPQIFSWLGALKNHGAPDAGIHVNETVNMSLSETTDRIHDFALSVSSRTPSLIGFLLFLIWITGIFTMILLTIRSSLRLRNIKNSALPLQNPDVRRLYENCLKEAGIKKNIPICSTAFLKSPLIVGFLNPCIYLPIHLISDYHPTDMRYILLHELQHYRHRDALLNYLMNLAILFYWFNPFVWYAFQEMQNDREIACDTSVLKMLGEDSYEDYGSTLLGFAEKISRHTFPFAAGLLGNTKQIKRRILHIAAYEKPTFGKKLKGIAAFMLTAVLLFSLAPILSTHAAETCHYQWNTSSENISYVDLSAHFGEYEGSFVLYDLENDIWNIYDMEHATLQVSPDSTYKIYDALFGLEEGIITPEDSLIPWNHENYPFESWNGDQTLQSAMEYSVNWYFQTMDTQLGAALVHDHIDEIGYGNENMSGGLTTYWMESSLKISPVEQVELLKKLYQNSFGFAPENINAVKESLCLSSSEAGTFYGKTGTGRVDGQDVNGWFIGFVESDGNTYFFATNIGASNGADGSSAAEITMSVLSDLNILLQ